MKINEAERLAGITKKNIRFYEEQGLLRPARSAGNGYREYSPADVERLRQIKLLRKLDLPVEEIRALLSAPEDLPRRLEEHLAELSRRQRDLARAQELCRRIGERERDLSSLDATQYLAEMQTLEEGGVRFVDVQKRDVGRKKRSAYLAALVMCVLMGEMLAMLLWGQSVDPLPLGLIALLLLGPIVVVCGVALALRQRLKEIEGGEEDAASQY
ncbi:MAG: MerR family transcriptional regulator [Oscillibacter sp.]|nr:MerR family transcriptional regulator [Oscillibacter sp.]MBR1690331.1 MerR family transcriptional regulator [Oscillibacter sp.]